MWNFVHQEAEPSVFSFSMTSGPQNISDNIQQPHKFVELFLTKELLSTMVQATTLYCDQSMRAHKPLPSNTRVHAWDKLRGNASESELPS